MLVRPRAVSCPGVLSCCLVCRSPPAPVYESSTRTLCNHPTPPSPAEAKAAYSSKRRLKPEMISAPQDDLKHTGHVGMDGTHFGDVSFLGDKVSSPPDPAGGGGYSPAAGPGGRGVFVVSDQVSYSVDAL